MKTVRRLFYVDIVSAVTFVAVASLSLSFFIDFIDEIGDVGQNGYTMLQAALYSLLQVPGHFYEVAPIAVLIGTIYTLARMAQSSEYTILRTGGLGPWRALSLLTTLGLAFGVLTFVVGDYLAPLSEQQANQVQATIKGGMKLGRSGAWLKDHVTTPEGERSYSINVGSAGPKTQLHDIRIFEFDGEGRLLRRIGAASAQVEPNQVWALQDVSVTRWTPDTAGAGSIQVPEQKLPTLAWKSSLSAAVVAAAVSPIKSMSTLDLARYIVHLADNEQASQSHRIQFWKRALYPFACLVMVGLALPFAYMHARAGSVSLKVFGGIMLGLSFVLLNNVAGHLGLLRDWTPWMVAAAPSLLYVLLSLAAFSWLVRYR
ncbi:MAG: LPS export ABC transporter permease LptG [Rhizobiales bacterium]|nr:LPS export ABC transporter permease LptG [Rhizobacter sp.]